MAENVVESVEKNLYIVNLWPKENPESMQERGLGAGCLAESILSRHRR